MSGTPDNLFASDTEYLVRLRDFVEDGSVRIEIDRGRLTGMDSPVAVEAASAVQP